MYVNYVIESMYTHLLCSNVYHTWHKKFTVWQINCLRRIISRKYIAENNYIIHDKYCMSIHILKTSKICFYRQHKKFTVYYFVLFKLYMIYVHTFVKLSTNTFKYRNHVWKLSKNLRLLQSHQKIFRSNIT